MKSVMKHQFSQVPQANIPRSVFNRSHGHKTTFDAGLLIPIFVDEALPGDTFTCKASFFARLSTPIVPIMDNLYLDTHFFAVPIRLIWDNWQKFNGEQKNPGDSTDFLCPTITAPTGGFAEQSIHDYFGLPIGKAGIKVNAFHHRAYNLIYNEWFRDQNLINSLTVKTDDGPDDPALYTIQKRAKRHDYFTSCLPWPQKGPGVEIPLGDSAVVKTVNTDFVASNQFPLHFRNTSSGLQPGTNENVGTDATGNLIGMTGAVTGSGTAYYPANLVADLSNATAATINSLRQAFQVQKLLERDARGGTRYTELLHAHFGVISPDARLQRPEYLGGSSTKVGITSVPQTSETGTTTPQGNLAAYGTVADSIHGFTKSFTEHCVVIGLCSVRADLNYQNGIRRMFSRQTRFDFYWPALANLGEQAVLSKEIFADGSQDDETVFGYQERWAEYRYFPSQITGRFRSQAAQPLDQWHLAQNYVNRPVLTPVWIEENIPLDRAIAVPNEPHFIFDSYFDLRCARPMPVYSVPGLIDHF